MLKNIICLQSLNHKNMDKYFNHWFRADAVHQTCLCLLLHFVKFVFFFFSHSLLLNVIMYKSNPQRNLSVVIKSWRKSVDIHLGVFFLLFFFFMFWLYVRKKVLIWMLHICWLCGVAAFQCDFCAVLFVNWELNSTKIRLIPRNLSTECTHHVKCNLCL